MMAVLLFALLIGVVAGMRSMTAPAAVSVAAYFGYLSLTGTALGWVATATTAIIFTVFALSELIGDQLPRAGSRKAAGSFIFRMISGAFSGMCLGAATPYAPAGAIAGAIGAVIGTMGFYVVRAKMAAAFGRDLPAALIEDGLAILFAATAIKGIAL